MPVHPLASALTESDRLKHSFRFRFWGYMILTTALHFMESFRFRPAMNFDRTVPVWISIPVTFQSRKEGAQASGRPARPGPAPNPGGGPLWPRWASVLVTRPRRQRPRGLDR